MNERLTELYRACRSKEALASQDQYKSANVLIGTELEKFVELLVRECCQKLENDGMVEVAIEMKQHFGVE